MVEETSPASKEEKSPAGKEDTLPASKEETPPAGKEETPPAGKEETQPNGLPSAGATHSKVKVSSAKETPPTTTTLSRKFPSADRIEKSPCRYVLGVPDPNGAVLFMVLLSVVYTPVTMWLLFRAAGQPTAIVWTISLVANSYIFLGSVRLMGLLPVFFWISYGVMVSVTAVHFMGPDSGAAVATLVTFYSAGVFGYAIGEYVHRVGSKKPLIIPQGSEDQKTEEPLIYFCFMHTALSLFVILRMMWIVLFPTSVFFLIAESDHTNEALLVVEELSLETIFIVWPWSSFMALTVLGEAAISSSLIMYKIPAWIVGSYILSIIVSAGVSKFAGLLFIWPAPMGMLGVLGFIVAEMAQYKRIQERKQLLHALVNSLSEAAAPNQD